MSRMLHGEPLSRGRERRDAGDRPLRTLAIGVAVFGAIWLLNGLVAILGMWILDALGWWPPLASAAGTSPWAALLPEADALQAASRG